MNTPRNNRQKNMHRVGRAFTIVELLVSIAIIAVISAISFWNSRAFSDSVAVTSVAEDVSLAIRDAQNYGSSVRESSVGSNTFNLGYGIDFDVNHPTFIVVFVDKNSNHVYDDDNGIPCDNSPGDECVEKIFLRDQVTMTSACIVNSSNSVICPAGWNSVQVSFLRPILDATINAVNGTSVVAGGPYAGSVMTFSSPLGKIKTIHINATGQVSVQ
jgi:prepilin-type N-terminal cleavage/methylation domain-containing protein